MSKRTRKSLKVYENEEVLRMPGRAYLDGCIKIGYDEAVRVDGELPKTMRYLRKKFDIPIEELI
jgi:hypothetical protein